jgi:phospholipid-translocating ATPase
MSDIPLRNLQRQHRAAEEPHISLSNMSSRTTGSAVAASRRNRQYSSARKNDRYADDSEEEQGLLGSQSYEDREQFEQEGSTSPVCAVLFHFVIHRQPFA